MEILSSGFEIVNLIKCETLLTVAVRWLYTQIKYFNINIKFEVVTFFLVSPALAFWVFVWCACMYFAYFVLLCLPLLNLKQFYQLKLLISRQILKFIFNGLVK